MRAAVLEELGKPIEVVDVDIRGPRTGEVLVRVVACGVCHSDLSVVDGSFPSPLPVVLGHEAAGVVEAVGAGVTSVAAGDKVVLTPLPACGQCYFCTRGQPTLCATYSLSLFTSLLPDGSSPLSRSGEIVYRGLAAAAWAEQAIMPEVGVVKVDDDVPLETACVLGCAVQTGVGAVLNTARVEEGATVLVLGAGGIGIAHELTGGIGVDYAFEAAGQAALIELGIAATRSGGTTVCVGAPPIDQGISIPGVVGFTATEKRLVGCLLGSVHAQRDIPRLLALWRSGRLDLDGMITERLPLAEAEAGLDRLRNPRGIRTVLTVG